MKNPKETQSKRSFPMLIVVKLPKIKDKDRILKTEREKCQDTCNGKTNEVNPSKWNPIDQKRVGRHLSVLRGKQFPTKDIVSNQSIL